MRREMVSWEEIEKLIDSLTVQFEREFPAMVIITRGGIIPGGMLAEAMGITDILTAAVDFPAQMANEKTNLLVWPQFIQFPDNDRLEGRHVLVVDDVWGSGRTSTAVKNRVSAAGGLPSTCVMHFNPHRSLFGTVRPDYFAASTDAYIVYPWELDRGPNRMLRDY
ncbi:MAG: phosphoribosyltransferase family protein [Chloroflexota bacterium]